MSRVSTYLNFPRPSEQAFDFNRSVFGSEFAGGVHRFADIPPAPGQPPLTESDRNLVMHVELPILGGHVLMVTDAPESMGFSLTPGNDVYINLEPDTHAETDGLFNGLSAGEESREAPAGDVLGRLLRQHHRSVRDQADVQQCQQDLSAPARQCRPTPRSAGRPAAMLPVAARVGPQRRSIRMGSRPLPKYTGICHCDAISFDIETDYPELTTCDCSICRRNFDPTGIPVRQTVGAAMA